MVYGQYKYLNPFGAGTVFIRPDVRFWCIKTVPALKGLNSSTGVNEFRGFLSQFSTNFHEIVHTISHSRRDYHENFAKFW